MFEYNFIQYSCNLLKGKVELNNYIRHSTTFLHNSTTFNFPRTFKGCRNALADMLSFSISQNYLQLVASSWILIFYRSSHRICSLKKNSYYRRTPLRLQLYQKRLQHRRFPVNIAKFLKHLFWGTCANMFGCFWFLLTKAKIQFSYTFFTSRNTINWRHISASNVYLILNVWLKMSSHVELYILYIRGTVYMKNCNLCLMSIKK